VDLIVQPDDGIAPLLGAVRRARHTIEIVVFRFDLEALEDELEAAVSRGVAVRALVAHTNNGGGKQLRSLEQRMLAAGVTVCRTADDLVRYHGKLLLVDRSRAFILGFNFTSDDLESRSFGVVSSSHRTVRELRRLFDADATRTPYTPRDRDLVVSPGNARARLAAFLRSARESIDIYDPQLTDDEMLGVLARRVARGVRVRVLGKLDKKWVKAGFELLPFAAGKLHVRAIVRDRREAFVGSQSLRQRELDDRRELGVVVRDRAVVQRLQKTFDADWRRALAEERPKTAKQAA
jgi:cardiolipin synthase